MITQQVVKIKLSSIERITLETRKEVLLNRRRIFQPDEALSGCSSELMSAPLCLARVQGRPQLHPDTDP